jgi:predicted aspartyl protease
MLAACATPDTGLPAAVDPPADAVAGAVDFTLAGPGEAALLVPVYLNGEGPFDFVIDTGATLSCVDNALARRLALDEQDGSVGVGASAGGVGQIRLVDLDSLRVGEARVTGLRVCMLDLRHARQVGVEAQGLLGLNFLRAFRVTFDFASNTVIFETPT